MAKPDGFLLYPRRENPWLSEKQRLHNFSECRQPLDEAARRRQAARCMNCGVPFCQSAIELKGRVTGCPLHNLIPEWNDEIWNHHDRHALDRLTKTNPFPEFTGRVCPALCEKACINGETGEPVTIHDNELFIIENAWEKGWMTPEKPAVQSGCRVAVVGSGPAGLAAAERLNKRGHQVTVFEKSDRPGGLLMYGIPNMKLDKGVIFRRLDKMRLEGVDFQCGICLGKDVLLEDLKADFDAVILAVGAGQPRKLDCMRPETADVCFALDFLTAATRHLLDGTPWIDAADKNVVIIGGGDTGNDCIATAMRQGAKSVTALEMMPAPPKERLASNPWPEWPNVAKTDYGHQEAIAVFGKDPRQYEKSVVEILEEDGTIKAVRTMTVSMDGGMHFVEGSEEILPCDLLVIAAGFTGVADDFGLATSRRNTFVTKPFSRQIEDKVFAAGDCRRGASLVVWAIHEGVETAKEVDKALMGYTNMEG